MRERCMFCSDYSLKKVFVYSLSLSPSFPLTCCPSLPPSLTHSLSLAVPPSLLPSLTPSLPSSLPHSLPLSLTPSLPHSLPASLYQPVVSSIADTFLHHMDDFKRYSSFCSALYIINHILALDLEGRCVTTCIYRSYY